MLVPINVLFIFDVISWDFKLLMIRKFSYAGEEFMRYLLRATLVKGMHLGQG